MLPERWGFLHFDADTDLIDLGALGHTDADNMCIVDKLHPTMYFEQKDMPHSGYVMPWKLFGVSKIDVPRDSAFLDTHTAALWAAHTQLTTTPPATDSSSAPRCPQQTGGAKKDRKTSRR